jgi:hypothetical protein
VEEWARQGYANPATYLYAQRERRRIAEEAAMRRHKVALAERARKLNQSGAEAATTVFTIPATSDDRR